MKMWNVWYDGIYVGLVKGTNATAQQNAVKMCQEQTGRSGTLRGLKKVDPAKITYSISNKHNHMI